MKAAFQKLYKKHARTLDTKWFNFTECQFQWIINQLKNKYKPEDRFSIMDLGCGTGRLLSMVHEHFPNAALHGIDGTLEMVFKAQNRLPLTAKIRKNNLDTYHLRDQYDVIVSTTVLHHLETPQTHLNMIASQLNPNGVAYISDICTETLPLRLANQWWTMTQPAHKHDWRQDDFVEMLTLAQFNITDRAVLSPDHFWRLQIYALNRPADDRPTQ